MQQQLQNLSDDLACGDDGPSLRMNNVKNVTKTITIMMAMTMTMTMTMMMTTFSHLHLAATVSSNSADSSAAHKAASLFPVLYLYVCICFNIWHKIFISAALL